MNDYVKETADDAADHAEEHAGNWQRHIEGAIYRRHAHLKALYRGYDPLPTDFLRQSSQYRLRNGIGAALGSHWSYPLTRGGLTDLPSEVCIELHASVWRDRQPS